MTSWRSSLRWLSAVTLTAGAVLAQERTIKGKVTDAVTQRAVAGATIGVKGTPLTAATDSEGAFTLSRAPAGDLTVTVDAENYTGEEVTLPAGSDSLLISLKPKSVEEEIVVTGRASETKRQNVAVSVVKVKSEEINDVPAQTVDEQLQGKVAGANIQRNDGAPGGGAQVRLRGVSSINGSAEPLYVVDGMIVSNISVPSGLSEVTLSRAGSNKSPNQDSLVNRIADLNPEDIESIEVLKGAAAAAIYGAKASNGVIIINTKKGQAGGPVRVDFTQRFGVSALSKTLGTRTFTSLSDALDVFCPPNSAGVRDPGCVAFNTSAYGNGKTIYDNESGLAGRHDLAIESILDVSGGGEGGLRYFVSGAVKNDPGIIANTGYQKQSVRINLGKDLADIWRVNVNTYVIHSIASRGIVNNDNSNTSFYIVLPFIPNYYDLRQKPDGTWPHDPYEPNDSNPLQTAALMKNDEITWRVLSSVDSTLRLLKDESQALNLIVNGGFDRFQQENDLLFPTTLYWSGLSGLPNGTALDANTNSLYYNLGINLVHNWSPPSGNYSATSSGGFQYESRDLNTVRVVGKNLISGEPSLGAATQVSVGQNREQVHDRGGYLQEEVLLLDRKLALTAAVRGDSSSTNGNPNALYFYPKASASYRFLSPVDPIDDLKLRLAYGETGNQPIYGARFTGQGVTTNINGFPATGVTGIAGNASIRPERAREIELGTDALLFGGRAAVELNLYQRTILDLLLTRAIAPTTGFDLQYFNGGVLRNRGIELGVEARPLTSEDWRWVSVATFAKNVSKITSLPVPAYNYKDFGLSYGVHRIEQGQSATQIVGNDGPLPDGTCCVVHKLGDSEPAFTMHFTNRISWRNFTLSFLVDWQQGSEVVNITRNLYDSGLNAVDQVPAGNKRLSDNVFSARPYVESASFVKLREISLTYDVPVSVLGRIGQVAKKVRLRASARNLLTFTPYSGMDPEVSNFSNDPIDRNIDLAPYPPSRSFWTSLEVGFY